MSRVPRTCVPQVMGPSGVMVGGDTSYLGLRSSARFGLSSDSCVPSVWAAGGYACRRGRAATGMSLSMTNGYSSFASGAVDPVRLIQCGRSSAVSPKWCASPLSGGFLREVEEKNPKIHPRRPKKIRFCPNSFLLFGRSTPEPVSFVNRELLIGPLWRVESMIKKVAFVGLGVGLLVTLAFGSRLPSYASTMFRSVQATVEDSVSLEFKLDDARNQLDKIGPEVNQMKYEFVRQELRVDKLEKDVAAARDNLEAQLAKIVVLRDHLDGGGSMFVSKGQSFTVKDVQKDIKRRWDLYKTQESVVTTKEQVLQAQQAGLEAARQKIAETEGLRETLEVEIAQLEARQKLVEVAKTSSEISFDDSRIARLRESLDDIRSRLEVEEHVVNNASAADFGGIPIEDEIEAGDLMAEIDSYLGGSSESVAELVH